MDEKPVIQRSEMTAKITQIKWKSQQLKLTLNPTATWKLFSLAASRGYLVQFSTV